MLYQFYDTAGSWKHITFLKLFFYKANFLLSPFSFSLKCIFFYFFTSLNTKPVIHISTRSKMLNRNDVWFRTMFFLMYFHLKFVWAPELSSGRDPSQGGGSESPLIGAARSLYGKFGHRPEWLTCGENAT